MTRATRLLRSDQASEAAEIIRGGGLVVFPTETVYGLGANALDSQAVAGIFEAKGRPQDNPLIVHIASLHDIATAVRSVGDIAFCLMEALCPGPLTVILPRNPGISSAVSAGLDTIGVRIPASPLAHTFLEKCGVPVAAPSANQSGRPSPTTFAMACMEMEGRVDAIMQGPPADYGLESTIVWPENQNTVHILRPGSVTPTILRRVLDKAGFSDVLLRWKDHSEILREDVDSLQATNILVPASPGTRYRHYSPRARVFLFRNNAELASLLVPGTMTPAGAALLGLHGESDPAFPPEFLMVTLFANIEEYAQKLYESLIAADTRGCTTIAAWLPPATDIGLALGDRLRRAAGLVG